MEGQVDQECRRLRVLELFSGIGGMHQALNLALEGREDLDAEVVAAVDINTVSNAVYSHNHPKVNLLNRNIAGLTNRELAALSVELVVMSPPCQPHTRQGAQKDVLDPRSLALSHLCSLLPNINSLNYLLLENVAGFETSEARLRIKSCLEEKGFECREFLICPRQIGIPNSRLRYYLLARRKLGWGLRDLQETFSLLPVSETGPAESVGDYLGDENEEDLVEEKVLEKRSQILDIVTRDSSHSCCFTGGYTRYSEGTGSVIQGAGSREDCYSRAILNPQDKVAILKELRLRYFSSSEVARLLGFPPSFNFPSNIGRRQQYKALGNSLNVKVVSLLLKHLLQD